MMFKIGDRVVYPGQGVAEITGIESKQISGTVVVLYMLRVLNTDRKIMIPVSKVQSVGLRKVIGDGEVERVYQVLRERTKTDLDIFLNTDAGLPRAERELAATAASRVNGCVYCASVHSAFTTQYSGRREDVQRLLDEGVSTRIDPRWDAIVDATVALTATPATFGADEIAGLEAAGLDDLEVLDTILSGAFFNWANRLMLSIGEPGVPPAE